MIKDNEYIEELLDAWELNFKKGQMSFWILLSLKNEARYLQEMIDFIKEYSNGMLQYDEQSIYRALRKFEDLELITYEFHESNKGPNLKYFKITSLGKKLLQQFVERNILIYSESKFINLFKK